MEESPRLLPRRSVFKVTFYSRAIVANSLQAILKILTRNVIFTEAKKTVIGHRVQHNWHSAPATEAGTTSKLSLSLTQGIY